MSDIPPKFAIFYEDDTIFEGGGEDDEYITVTLKVSRDWLKAPVDGVQAVVCEDKYVSRYVYYGKDYFFPLMDGMMYASDDLAAFLRKRLKGFMKFGLCVDRPTFEGAMEKVKKYTRIPRDGKRSDDPTRYVK